MRDFDSGVFNGILTQVKSKEQSLIKISIAEKEFVFLEYYLTRHCYYAKVVDDYSFEIVDKTSLLEALYYQVKLVTVHGLNWDAIQEGFEDLLDNLENYEGICLLFKKKDLHGNLTKEFTTLMEILGEINKHSSQKRISLLLNE